MGSSSPTRSASCSRGRDARIALPEEAGTLERLVADSPAQQERARRIVEATRSYLRDYSIPLVASARRDPAAARTVAATDEGRRRMDALRAEFDRFVASERGLAAARERRSDAATPPRDRRRGGWSWRVDPAGAAVRGLPDPRDRAAGPPGGGHGRPARRRRPRCAHARARRRRDRGAGGAASTPWPARWSTAARSWRPRGRGSWPPATRRDGGSNATCTTVPSSGWCRWCWICAPPRRRCRRSCPSSRAQLARVADGLTGALEDLRELSRGIHPAVLSEGGLAPALKALARRSAVPVELEVEVPARLAEPVEVAAYYVVSEALANTAKHAHASVIHVEVQAGDDRLQLSVRDDGVGGARPGGVPASSGSPTGSRPLGGPSRSTAPPGRAPGLQIDLPVQDRPSS